MDSPLRRDVREASLRERRVGRVLGDLHVVERAREEAAVDLLAQRPSEFRVGVDDALAGEVGPGGRLHHRHALEREGRREVELEHQRAAGHLRDHADAARLQRCRPLEHRAVAIGPEHPAEQRRPADRAPGALLDGGELGEEEPGAERRLHHVTGLGEATGQRRDLLPRGDAARHRTALPADVRRRLGGSEADRARAQRLGDERAHRGDLVRRRLALHRLLAHHVEADRGVAHERAHVDRGAAALDRVQVLRERLEGPLGADARAQRVERHAFHLLEREEHELTVRGPRRRDAEAAVAHHHRGDAVPRRDGQHAVPEDLGVVVGVDVDEAGRDDGAVGVEHPIGGAGRGPDRGDPSVADRDVGAACRRAGPVDDRSAADQEVEMLGHRRFRSGP